MKGLTISLKKEIFAIFGLEKGKQKMLLARTRKRLKKSI